MNITVIGSGYVGLVTGACLAEMGNSVVCMDSDAAKIADLSAGKIPIYEPGLEALVHDNCAANRLRFGTDLPAAVAHGEVIFIAVGTPQGEDGGADLQYVLGVAEGIGDAIAAEIAGGYGNTDGDTDDTGNVDGNGNAEGNAGDAGSADGIGNADVDAGDTGNADGIGNADGDAADTGNTGYDYRIIATKSTVPVGTAERVRTTITAAITAAINRREVDHSRRNGNNQSGKRFGVVSNPEFLKQGAAVEDCMKPDRIIIGADHDRDFALMRKLYAPFNRNHERVIAMDLASAELTKYAANAMLATRISTMNEIANLAEKLGADIEAVRVAIGADPRIGYAFIYAGCGYGGSCFPKDVRALRKTAAGVGYEARILGAIEQVNDAQKHKPLDLLRDHFGDDLRGKKFALWGLAFKPDTDDMREAPSRVVLEGLWKSGAKVAAFDPAATLRAREIYGERDDLTLHADDPYDALNDADALIVVTEWRAFRAADPAKIRAAMRGDVVVDARNLYDPQTIRNAGLVYYGIGRR